MSEWVDPEVLREAIDTWNEGQLKCRARGRHNWNPYTLFKMKGLVWDVHEECGLCRNRRHRLMYGKGHRYEGQWIDPKWHPERYGLDYLLPKGSGRLSPAQQGTLRALEMSMRSKIVEVAA